MEKFSEKFPPKERECTGDVDEKDGDDLEDDDGNPAEAVGSDHEEKPKEKNPVVAGPQIHVHFLPRPDDRRPHPRVRHDDHQHATSNRQVEIFVWLGLKEPSFRLYSTRATRRA